ncbi:NCS2 family permease [Paenibacillus doosanensis]|uniref:NCS2 family permease n=1 Tax=Paenibacillus doosanensis TaxID=1229154 RepID=UPI00217F4F49|nr:NCS2 family permease [Paenibacillus doosanensis]MCS7462738.1 NCS2 family permease [Paenibacillus doosanensis]
MIQRFNRHFALEAHGTTWRRELMAGLTSFFTCAYIVLVNPLILQDSGIPLSAGVMATLVASIVGCLLMALWANAPIIVIPGMGLNAFFSYTIVQSLGLSWQQGLAAVTVSGILFLIVSVTSFGGRIVGAVPPSLKHGITAGIGLLLTFIGLQKGEIIRSGSATLVTVGSFHNPVMLSTLAGLAVTFMLFVRNVKGSLLIGIFVTSLITFAGTGKANMTTEALDVRAYGRIMTSIDFHLWQVPFWIAVFSMTMIVLFENMGLLSGMLPDARKFPKAYQTVAFSAVLSGLLGTSPTIASAESASGISEGGRTGIPALITAVLLGVSALALPFIGMIPGNAVAPVLIVIGALMMKSVQEIPFHDLSEVFPAFLIIVCIPLTSSIADGLAFGFIAYPLMKLATGQFKQVPAMLYVIAALFMLNFIASSVYVH